MKADLQYYLLAHWRIQYCKYLNFTIGPTYQINTINCFAFTMEPDFNTQCIADIEESGLDTYQSTLDGLIQTYQALQVFEGAIGLIFMPKGEQEKSRKQMTL